MALVTNIQAISEWGTSAGCGKQTVYKAGDQWNKDVVFGG